MDAATLATDAAKAQEALQTPQALALLAYIDQRLAALPPVAALETQLDKAVPGWRTSEFWMTNIATLGLILASCSGALPAKYAVVAAGLSQAAYSISRGLAKKGSSN